MEIKLFSYCQYFNAFKNNILEIFILTYWEVAHYTNDYHFWQMINYYFLINILIWLLKECHL